MYIGYAGFAGYLGGYIESFGMIFFSLTLVLGMLLIIGSSIMYMWVGMLSTKAARVECPSCKKVTKILGTTDQCMFCKQTLTFDPNVATDMQNSNES